MSGRSVTGLKSVIFFFNSHGTNDQTSRGGKNFKKGIHKDCPANNATTFMGI